MLASETLRNAANRVIRTDKPKGEEGISMFWRVFGGTILSIVALVFITAYTQMTGTMSDLRKELNQVQGDLLKKDEFNNRLTTMWSSIKDLQTANNTLVALNERFKLIDQQMDKQSKGGDDDRKKMQRRLDEQRKAGEERNSQAVSFPTPAGVSWADISMRFVDGHTVSVRVRDVCGRFNYTQMGMVDRRNSNPTKQWELLRDFAAHHGVLDWSNPGADRRNQKRREILATNLREFFHIDGDPIELTEDGKGWRVLFLLHPEV